MNESNRSPGPVLGLWDFWPRVIMTSSEEEGIGSGSEIRDLCSEAGDDGEQIANQLTDTPTYESVFWLPSPHPRSTQCVRGF
jgi:hypothetical protein